MTSRVEAVRRLFYAKPNQSQTLKETLDALSPEDLLVDARYPHPILHESAEQLTRTYHFDNFKAIWQHRHFASRWNDQSYKDKYGCTPVQRLQWRLGELESILEEHDEETYQMHKWMYEEILGIPYVSKFGETKKNGCTWIVEQGKECSGPISYQNSSKSCYCAKHDPNKMECKMVFLG